LLEEAKSAVSDMLGVSDQDVREDPIISCAPKRPTNSSKKENMSTIIFGSWFSQEACLKILKARRDAQPSKAVTHPTPNKNGHRTSE